MFYLYAELTRRTKKKFCDHFNDRIDIPHFARKCTSDFFDVFNGLGKHLDHYTDNDILRFRNAVEYIRTETGGIDTAVLVKSLGEEKLEEIQIFPEFLDRLKRSGRRLPTRLENHYVSSRPSKHAPGSLK